VIGTMRIAEQVAQRIRAVLIAKGWDEKRLVEKSGLSSSLVKQLLGQKQGEKKKSLRAENLAKAALGLQISADYLLGIDPRYEGFDTRSAVVREALLRFLLKANIPASEWERWFRIADVENAATTVEAWEDRRATIEVLWKNQTSEKLKGQAELYRVAGDSARFAKGLSKLEPTGKGPRPLGEIDRPRTRLRRRPRK